METQVLLAGFGGQGILFAGKVLAYSGMVAGKNVSWLPSYGPEMRGGTANCHVIISDDPVGSPIITDPNVLVAMNKPSLERFESDVVKNGCIIIDSSLVDREPSDADVEFFAVPATKMGGKSANMIILGKIFRYLDFIDLDGVKLALSKSIPASKKNLLDTNLDAIHQGYNYI